MNRPSNSPGGLRGPAFTLIELMVVVAIIAVLVTVTVPAIKSISQAGQLAQSENILRASLIQARGYAIRRGVVAGLRFQDDGRVIMIYARNVPTTYNVQNYVDPPAQDMKAAPGYSPAQLPGPWRVTADDVGIYGLGYRLTPNDVRQRWIGPTTGPGAGYFAAPEWLDEKQAWLAFPVVLFNPEGRVILAECKFRYSTNPDEGWYPTMEGSFGKACDNYINRNRWFYMSGERPGPYIYGPAPEPLKHTNQVMFTGWRSTSIDDYKGTGSHDIPIESPSVTAAPHLFDYVAFRGQFTYRGSKGPFDYAAIYRDDPRGLEPLYNAAWLVVATGSTCRLDTNTGMIVRTRAFEGTWKN